MTIFSRPLFAVVTLLCIVLGLRTTMVSRSHAASAALTFEAQNIVISGTLKDTDGKSLTGIHVAAMPVNGNVPVGTSNTDRFGRYSLELPPGAYYVIAGNIFWPTYYTSNGSNMVISTSRNGVDFVVNAASFRPPPRREALPQRQRDTPLQWDVPPMPPKLPRWPR